MLLNLILGGAGSGKSKLSEDKIRESINTGKRALVIVPERFSHVEERTLIESFGGLGLFKIEVTTFSKMTRRIVLGKDKLLPSGKQMLIMKAAKENKSAGDGIFEGIYNLSGFAEKISDTIDELKKNMITPEDILSQNQNGILGRKIDAIGNIYKTYQEYLGEKYSEPDENLLRLSNVILEEGGFSDTDIYIDGFSDFMAAHYGVIESLVKMANSVTVMLTLPKKASYNPDGIFMPVLESYDKLLEIAKNLGASVNKEILDGEYDYVKSEDIKYFLSNYEEVNCQNVPDVKNISVNTVFDRHEEIKHLASGILKEVRDNGLRYRDIGVIAGDLGKYLHIIETVFDEYKIPYAVDSSTPALSHPAVRIALLAFRVIKDNFSFNSVFEYLKSGYIYEKDGSIIKRISQDDIDTLELYVKSRGIRGRAKWLQESDWTYIKKGVFDEATSSKTREEDISHIDSLRRKVMEPFAVFYEKIKGRQKVRGFASSLYEFLSDIHIFDGLLIEKKHFEDKNMLDDAALLESVWNVIINTLDQAVMTSGDEYMSRDDFLSLLETGLSMETLDSVPPGIDRVSIGRADVTRPVLVKALFAIGAVKGEMPKDSDSYGIITDSERMMLSEDGFNILKTNDTRKKLSEFNLFSSFTAAGERIYITYPEILDDGEEAISSEIVSDIVRMFGITPQRLSKEQEVLDSLSSASGVYNKMVYELSSDLPEERREFWEDFKVDGFKNTDNSFSLEKAQEDSDLSIFYDLDMAESDIFARIKKYKNGGIKISKEIAEKLYKNKAYSISALQKFNECPFSYYATYGLKIDSDSDSERRVESSDIGTMIHWAVSEFCKEVQENKESVKDKKECWDNLNKEKLDAILSGLMEEIKEKTISSNPNMSDVKISLILKKAERTIKRSLDVIKDSITKGEFAALDFEKEFDFNLSSRENELKLRGIIDRIDIAETDEGELIRIIDYKTGSKTFSVSGICNKTDLQLMVYALAAEDMYKKENAKVTSLMYNTIRDELTKTDGDLAVSVKSAPLDGIIICENEDTKDQEILYHDRTLSDGGVSSQFLPLSTKKAGGLKKSGMILSRKQFDLLKSYVKKTAIETDKLIKNGDISPYPLGNDEYSPCAWCKFSSLCLFDNQNDKAREKVTSNSKAWEMMESEAGNE